jgi:hypothetical protein
VRVPAQFDDNHVDPAIQHVIDHGAVNIATPIHS